MRRLTCPPGLPDQAYNAEKAGAKAIIVADYKNERLLTMAVPEDRPERSPSSRTTSPSPPPSSSRRRWALAVAPEA